MSKRKGSETTTTSQLQFTLSTRSLREELTLAQRVVERKSMFPALSCALIEAHAEESTISITVSDVDITLRSEVLAQISAPGTICPSAAKLFEIARLGEADEITFTQEANDWVAVTCGAAKFRLPGIPRSDFPDVAQKWPDKAAFRLPAATVKRLIESTAFAISTNEGRYTLGGALLVSNEKGIALVATDGHRLSRATAPLAEHNGGEPWQQIVPRKALSALSSLATAAGDESLTVAKDEQALYFRAGSRRLAARVLAGQFPNYEAIFPKDNDKRLVAESETFRQALKRVAVMADTRSSCVELRLKPGTLELSARSSEAGQARESLAIEYQGPELRLAANGGFLTDFLGVMNQKVVLTVKNAESVVELQPLECADGETVTGLVMPMRL